MTEDDKLLDEFFAVQSGAPAPEVEGAVEVADEDTALLDSFLAEQGGPSTPRPKPRRPADKANFLEKAYDQARLGVGDFFETMAGDTRGRGTDDPLERTPVSLPFRPVAAAADVLRGGGAAIGEVVSAADSAIGNPLSKSLAWMGENQAEHPIYKNAGLEQASKDLDEWSPEYAPAIKDILEVGSAAAAFTKPFKMTAGSKKMANLPETVRKQNRTDIESRWSPERAFDEPGTVKEKGFWKTSKFKPAEGSRRELMYDELELLDDLDPRASRGNNFNIVDDAAEKLRKELDAKLTFSDHMDVDKINSTLEVVREEVSGLPAMSATGAKGASDAVFRQWKKLTDKYGGEGVITAKDLLQARRDLDQWLQANRPKVLEAGTVTGEALAVKQIRQSINDLVGEAVPDAGVAESLAKQSRLLTARDEIRQAANNEVGSNRLTRALGETQEKFGLTMPHSPAAVGANLQAGPLIMGTGLMGATTMGRGLKRAKNLTAAGVTDAIQPIYNTTRGAIPSTTLPEDEEVPYYLRRRQNNAP